MHTLKNRHKNWGNTPVIVKSKTQNISPHLRVVSGKRTRSAPLVAKKAPNISIAVPSHLKGKAHEKHANRRIEDEDDAPSQKSEESDESNLSIERDEADFRRSLVSSFTEIQQQLLMVKSQMAKCDSKSSIKYKSLSQESIRLEAQLYSIENQLHLSNHHMVGLLNGGTQKHMFGDTKMISTNQTEHSAMKHNTMKKLNSYNRTPNKEDKRIHSPPLLDKLLKDILNQKKETNLKKMNDSDDNINAEKANISTNSENKKYDDILRSRAIEELDSIKSKIQDTQQKLSTIEEGLKKLDSYYEENKDWNDERCKDFEVAAKSFTERNEERLKELKSMLLRYRTIHQDTVNRMASTIISQDMKGTLYRKSEFLQRMMNELQQLIHKEKTCNHEVFAHISSRKQTLEQEKQLRKIAQGVQSISPLTSDHLSLEYVPPSPSLDPS